MSTYYKYDFVSPAPIYAIVQEEFKSYFNTGAIDDLLFPTWTDRCLKSLNRGALPIMEVVLHIENYLDNLPDDFYAVREAWACHPIQGPPVKNPGAIYQQISNKVDQEWPNDPSIENGCLPEVIYAVYKTNTYDYQQFHRDFLLKPGNISSHPGCKMFCKSPGASTAQSFDVKGGQFTTNFREGWVHLTYYADNATESGTYLIPDNFRIRQYIEAYLKYKSMEMLTNLITDETQAQLEKKLERYKAEADQCFVLAETETKKQTSYQKQRFVHNTLNRNNMYQLPDSNYRRRRY